MDSKITKIRSVALVLIEKDGKILACPGKDNTNGILFCRPPGGGIEFGETSLQAATREIKEEIGATLINAKFLTVLENIFTYNGAMGHEMIFLYKGDMDENHIYAQASLPILDKEGHVAEWIPISEIKTGEIQILPVGIDAFL